MWTFLFCVFIFCVFTILYTYFGYLFFLRIKALLLLKPVFKKENLPFVSIVIAVYNGDKYIERKLINILSQNYPPNKFEVLVVSDGSIDNTNLIVEKMSLRYPNVKLIKYFPRRGKPYAINKGVSAARGEIVVFADARQIFDVNALRELVYNFADKSIGCVSGELIFVENLDSKIRKEMGIYWNYEKKIRKLESQTGSVVGATGAIYAIRKKLFEPIPENILLDDVYIPLLIAEKKFRVVFDSAARAFDIVSPDFSKEKRRKIRTLLGNWQLVFYKPSIICPFGHPLWFRFVSHKFLRLLIPFFVFVSVLVSIFLGFPYYFYALFFIFCLFLTILPGSAGSLFRSLFFLNYCALLSFVYLLKKKWDVW